MPEEEYLPPEARLRDLLVLVRIYESSLLGFSVLKQKCLVLSLEGPGLIFLLEHPGCFCRIILLKHLTYILSFVEIC